MLDGEARRVAHRRVLGVIARRLNRTTLLAIVGRLLAAAVSQTAPAEIRLPWARSELTPTLTPKGPTSAARPKSRRYPAASIVHPSLGVPV